MIEVSISHDGVEIARISFVKTNEGHVLIDKEPFIAHLADYIVNIGVERLGDESSVGIYVRSVTGHKRLQTNVLGLLKEALNQLDEKELSLDETTYSSDMARGLRGVSPALQAWASRLRDNGPALRSGQPVEHGEDPGW